MHICICTYTDCAHAQAIHMRKPYTCTHARMRACTCYTHAMHIVCTCYAHAHTTHTHAYTCTCISDDLTHSMCVCAP